MPKQKLLDIHQQELMNIVKAAHQTLALARKARVTELARRMAEEKLRAEREFEQTEFRVRDDLAAEIAGHESNLDEALIFAYNKGVPIRRIALEGFGNRYDGGVNQLILKLRADGRIGHREGWQSNTSEYTPTVAFPKALDLKKILTDVTTIAKPDFTINDERLVLVAAGESGSDAVTVIAVTLTLDSRDPWFVEIAKDARPGTPHAKATEVTLYEHPATGELITHESRESGEQTWDHPVARWARNHPEAALAGFRGAILEDFLAHEDGDGRFDELATRTAPESSE